MSLPRIKTPFPLDLHKIVFDRDAIVAGTPGHLQARDYTMVKHQVLGFNVV